MSKEVGRVCRLDVSWSSEAAGGLSSIDKVKVVYLHDYGHPNIPLTIEEARELARLLVMAADNAEADKY